MRALLIHCAALVATLSALSPKTAWAADRVVILAAPRLALRLEAEFATMGVESILDARTDAETRILETLAEENEAIATILLRERPMGTEIWMIDRATGKTIQRRISVEEGDDLAVTKAVELLRSSLLEVRIAPPTEKDASTPPPSTANAKPVEPAEPEVAPPIATIRVGPAIGFGDGSLTPTLHLASDLLLHLGSHVLLGGTVAVPTFPAYGAYRGGEVYLTHGFALLGAEAHPFSGGAMFDLRFGLAAGVDLAYAENHANVTPYREATATSFLAMATTGLAVWTTPEVSVDFEFGCGITAPRIDLIIRQSGTLSHGWPQCLGTVGAGFRL